MNGERAARVLTGRSSRLFAAAAIAIASLPTQSALLGRDINGNPVPPDAPSAVFEYDTDLNITWLRDWNYSQSRFTWEEAQVWASTLTLGVFGGWRLPAPDSSCETFNCITSEMGHVWYAELGNIAPEFPGPPDCTSTNPGPFTSMMTGGYWTNQEYAPDPSSAWYFSVCRGGEGHFSKSADFSAAVAVRPGDVFPVPEPSSLALIGVGLAALAARARFAHRRCLI